MPSLTLRRGLFFEDGPTAIGLLGPGLISLLALGTALMASGVHQTVLSAFVGLQATLLALAAAMLTSAATMWTANWQGRVAPTRAVVHVRQRLWRQLAVSAGLGVCGPLALAFHAEVSTSYSLARMPQMLLAVLALLLAAQALGGWCGLAWRGRAGRWVLLGWVALVLALSAQRALREWLLAWPALSMLTLLLLSLGWWVLRQRLVQHRQRWAGVPATGAAKAAFQPAQVWQPLPFDGEEAQGQGGRFSEMPAWRRLVLFLLWVLAVTAWRHQAWESQVQGVGLATYAGWMAMLTGLAGCALVHPAAHWRRRLAPGGLTPLQWARRMVLRSLAGGLLALAVLVGVAAFSTSVQGRWAVLGTGATVLGDLCLAFTLVAWVRARRNDFVGLLLAVVLMFGAVFMLTTAAAAIGLPLVRGAGWLAVELALAAVLGAASVRRWAARNGL
ncbi:hypothetical protein NYO99_01665 [Pelomonas sp. UHG3]|uniref:Uncharacterized protein n=1 Tax=Roseateles hydrophilus TaxID=2975054 RepID=A0ACC6C5U1_9BURK|nr:hypothetical protein [Pelomonas sp. UHG3]MCY4743675.1 hypothetical protein [Pelomonas sp. UHG3]